MSIHPPSKANLETNNLAYLGYVKLFEHSFPAHNQFVNVRDQQSALDLAEYYFRCGMDVFQQVNNERFFHTLNRSLLAMIYARKGEWDEALKLAEDALDDAIAQGGSIRLICEIFLSAILLERGEHIQARGHLSSAMEALDLLKRTDVETTAKDSPRFRIHMFGPIRVFHGGEEINAAQWRTVKSRHLLAYLAHQNRPVSTDQIIEDLWPDLDPDKALALFHTTLYYLRRLINQFTQEELIIRGSKRYQLRPGSVFIDRFQFEKSAHFAFGKEITADLAEELESAVSLYQGDYLEDLDYQWIIPVQEELRNLNVELRQKLAVYYLQNKMPAKALLHLQQLMAANPYSETTLKLLLTACAERGDQAAIIRHYTIFAKNISEELGLQPSLEMERFFANIVNQKSKAAL
jgi:two-component SAPR family response regulator